MPNFRFDDGKSFEENCKVFLEKIKSSDPDLAKILSDNWDGLVAIVHEGVRDPRARVIFNAEVASALDVLAKSVESKDDP